jgi:uncharacterized protein YecE (DUF72 family)
MPTLRIGTAGWSIPRDHPPEFSSAGSHLKRYSSVLSCVEINSSFYRPHRPSTYARWAASTPDNFRFSVKMPRSITHECALATSREDLQMFLNGVRHLGAKLGPILVQLPPRQNFEIPIAKAFLSLIRDLYPSGYIALEPRHPTWFSLEPSDLLQDYRIARVVADPSPAEVVGSASPSGRSGLDYFRLHGSPHVYYSNYSPDQLDALSRRLCERLTASEVWCIFDNTAAGAAVHNALSIQNVTGTPHRR